MIDPDSATLVAAAREGVAAADASGAPPTSWHGRARVRIWQQGWIIGEGEAADPNAPTAVRTAATRAAADRQPAEQEAPPPEAPASQFHNEFDDQPATEQSPSQPPTFLEIETVGAIEAINPQGLSGLLQSVRTSHEGLVLSHNGRLSGGWPTDPLHAGEPTPYWIKGLLKQARPPGYWLPASVTVQRFTANRLLALLEPPTATNGDPPPDRIVELHGDTRLVAQDEVTHDRLLTAALQAGAWLGRHQLPNGLFHYEFIPQLDEWSPTDSIVRQAGCAWSMAKLARTTRQKPFVAAAARAIAGLIQTGLKHDGPGGIATLADADGHRRVGAIPLTLLALAEIEGRAHGPTSPTEDLTATLLALQDRTGAFTQTVRGTELGGSETYYAGQCALALARRYLITKRDRLAEAVRAALKHYRDWWMQESNRDLAFPAWMIQACELADAIPATAAAADFAYDMADWTLDRQYSPAHPIPTWAGGFEGGPGIGTAAYAEGIAAAWALARRRGDTDRAARYRTALLQAQRFLLQLQLGAVDLVFVRSPGHHGAVRRSLGHRALRCDNAQHFLMAALRTASLLEQEQHQAQGTDADTDADTDAAVQSD